MEPREQFERLYLAHAGVVRRFAARRGDVAEADDVVAEVFLSAWRRMDEVPADPLPWLLGLARGVLANRRRSEDRHAALIARLMSERPVNATGGDNELELDLVTALGALSAGDQELLLLVAWEGLSSQQIAEVLGLRRGTVAVRLHRARRRLQRALATRQQTTKGPGERSPQMEVL